MQPYTIMPVIYAQLSKTNRTGKKTIHSEQAMPQLLFFHVKSDKK